jgi:hypothetical protein
MSEIIASPTVDVQGGLSDMLRAILLLLPKALLFLVILVVGYFVARLLAKVVNRVLERIGFDRVVERGGIRAALARSKYDASDIVAKLVYYAILLVTLQLAFGVWGPNPVSDLINAVVAWLPNAFVAIIIIVVAAAIGRAVKDLISGALGGLSYGGLLANVAAYFIIGLGVIAALNQIGVATTVTLPVLIAVLATVAGILIVGVGGGLVKPMQTRWESWLDRASAESQTIAERAKAYSAEAAVQREAAAREAAAREAVAQREAAGAQRGAPAQRDSADSAPAGPVPPPPTYAPGVAPAAPPSPTATAPIVPADAAAPVRPTPSQPVTTAQQPAVVDDGWPNSQPTQVIPPTPAEPRHGDQDG